MKVKGLNELAKMVEYNTVIENHEKKAIREIRKQRIAELIAEGVDKEIAKVMVNAELASGL